jgi:hypothetical protein
MFTIDQKYQQGRKSARLLEGRGSFAEHLADLYFVADPTNAIRLRDAFPELLQVVPIEEERQPADMDKAYFIDQLLNFLKEQKNG